MAQIGIQLYSLREETKLAFFGTIIKVAKAGYQGVEFAGYHGAQAVALKKLLTDHGLVAAGAHLGLAPLESSLEANLEYCLQIECPAVIVPFIDATLRPDLDGYKRVAERFNRLGEACRKNGLKFMYHQHGFEFQDLGGKTGMEILDECTDPALVGFEPDVYWIEHAGVDAVQFMKKYGARAWYIHCKDAANKTDWRDTEAGAGVIDMAGVIHEARKHNATWYILEQEHFDLPPMESIAISLKNLQRLTTEA